MISKELLSLVLGEEVVDVHYNDAEILCYDNGESPLAEINLDTLGRLCKEWCSTQYYSLLSGWCMTHWGGAYQVEVKQTNKVLYSQSTCNTELEAIIKATEWVAKEKGLLC